jgi:hypothetical protein
MKSRTLGRAVLAMILFVPAPSLATVAVCYVPPGPPGEVRCTPDDMALCEATGRQTLGQCLDRPEGGVRAEQRVILEKILKRPPTDQELAKWSAALATGIVRMGDSVFTFDLGAGTSDDGKGGNGGSTTTTSTPTSGRGATQVLLAVVVLLALTVVSQVFVIRSMHARANRRAEKAANYVAAAPFAATDFARAPAYAREGERSKEEEQEEEKGVLA